MSSEIVSTQPNPLDELASRVTADIEHEAAEELLQPFFADIMAQVEVMPPAARKYTAAHFFLRQPEKFKVVVHYLARGIGVKRVAALAGCHLHTVQAVRDRFPKSVATEKERLADLCMQASTLMVETIIDNPEKVPAQSWGLTAAQLADKALLLRGGPTVTIEHRHTFSHEDFNKLVEAAPIEIEAQRMGLSGEKSLPNADASAEGEGLAGDQENGSRQGETDSASVESQRAGESATRPATPPPPEAGGEGVPENGGGVD